MQAFIRAVGFLSLVTICGQAVAADTPKGKTEVTWFGHAAWVIKTPAGATLVIDPWLDNPKAPKDVAPPANVDAILVTHGHFDHVGSAAALASKTGAAVIGSYELVSLIGATNAMGANAGGTIRIKDATIHLVEAVHSSSFSPKDDNADKSHPPPPLYAGAAVGFVVAIDNGPTIYHAGDTDVFNSMSLIAERYHPSVAMLPIGGHFTMDPDEAALAASMLKVSTVMPMHYGTFPVLTGTPDQLKAALGKHKSKAKVVAPNPGEVTAL